MSRYRIEPLQARHAVEAFDCGEEPLNRFLVRFALANQRARASRSYVALDGNVVVGIHTLVVGEVSPEQAPERIRKGLARHPIPLMVLARLAVAVAHQGKGLGAALLKDAIARTLAAAEIAGIRALAVHAKDERARGFYEHFGFRPSPTDPLHLFVLLEGGHGHLHAPCMQGLSPRLCAVGEGEGAPQRIPSAFHGQDEQAGDLREH